MDINLRQFESDCSPARFQKLDLHQQKMRDMEGLDGVQVQGQEMVVGAKGKVVGGHGAETVCCLLCNASVLCFLEVNNSLQFFPLLS